MAGYTTSRTDDKRDDGDTPEGRAFFAKAMARNRAYRAMLAARAAAKSSAPLVLLNDSSKRVCITPAEQFASLYAWARKHGVLP